MWLPIASFILAALGTPAIAKMASDRGFVGRDLNKHRLPEIPEAGGIVIFLITTFSLIYLDFPILSGIVILMGLFSLLDDVYQYGTVFKVAAPLLISLLFYFEVGSWGLLLAVPYFILIVNLSNTLAGFNGLEIGLGALISLFFAIFLFARAAPFAEPLLILFGACLGFLIHNWYPAKVFPGDVGTHTIGACLAGVAILSGYWYVLLFLYLPHLADITLKFYSAGIFQKILSRSSKNTLSEYKPLINRNGKLYLPEKSYLSLIRLILRKPRSEQETVLLVLLAEALLGAILAITLVIA